MREILVLFKRLAKVVYILLLIPSIGIALWIGKSIYDFQVRSRVPLATATFIKRLPGTIVLGGNSWSCLKKQDCTAYTALDKGFMKIDDYIDKTLPGFEVWQTTLNPPKVNIVPDSEGHYAIQDEKTGEVTTLVTENREPRLFCISSDKRYLLYNVYYPTGHETSYDELFLYYILDLKTKQTYRLFPKLIKQQSCLWLDKKVKLSHR